MGNDQCRYKALPRPATLNEVLSYHATKYYVGAGMSEMEALDNLRKVCDIKGLPPIKQVPGDSSIFYCGMMTNPLIGSRQKLYNTVFLKEKSKRKCVGNIIYLACVYV